MQPEQQNYWQKGPDEVTPADVPTPDVAQSTAEDMTGSPISWQASEYIHHEKSGAWFLALLGAGAVLLVVDIFLLQSWTFGVLIVVMALAAAVIARRPPRIIAYSLTAQGIHIDQKFFSFHDFRAFGVLQEGAFFSVRLIPNKRFMPMVSVFFPSELGEQIIDVFGAVMPMEHIDRDPIDKLVEKIRF